MNKKSANKGLLYADGVAIACVTAWDVAWTATQVGRGPCENRWVTGNLALICGEAQAIEMLEAGRFRLKILPQGDASGAPTIEGDVSLASVAVNGAVGTMVQMQAVFKGRMTRGAVL